MDNTINIRIESESQTVEDSLLLDKLRLEIEGEVEIPCSKETIPAPADTQAGELLTALGFLVTSVPVIQIVFDVTKYYIDNKRRCSITVQKKTDSGETRSYTIESMTVSELNTKLKEIEDKDKSDNIENVTVSIKD